MVLFFFEVCLLMFVVAVLSAYAHGHNIIIQVPCGSVMHGSITVCWVRDIQFGLLAGSCMLAN